MKKMFILIAILIFILVILLFIKLKSQTPTPSPSFSPTPIPSITPAILTPSKTGAGIESTEYKKAEEEYIKSTPILQKLPVKSTYFSIEYIDEEHLVVVAKTSNKSRDYQIAKNWFIENNINFDKINIEYK